MHEVNIFNFFAYFTLFRSTWALFRILFVFFRFFSPNFVTYSHLFASSEKLGDSLLLATDCWQVPAVMQTTGTIGLKKQFAGVKSVYRFPTKS
jgi:hypothetical protein